MKNILIEEIKALLDEPDFIAALANCSAHLNTKFDNINWLGFYLLKNDELVLGPFQGKVACTHLKIGSGVCGDAVKLMAPLLVANVHDYDGHIACDSESNSELVCPLIFDNKVYGVLDIDSPVTNYFKEEDLTLMQLCANEIAIRLSKN